MWRSIDHASISDSEYDTFLLHDTICGHEMGGERVPTRLWQYDTYDFQAGYEIETFAPIVAYGSLESVRSAHLAGSAPCYEGFAPEDVALQLHCKGLDSSAVAQRSIHLRRDASSRRTQAPMATHRRYCDPQRRITVEDALARPRAFTEALYDSSLKRAQHLDNLVVPAAKRGEEDFDKRRSTLSLKGWVYITSSADASIRPGMHQLIDLPVFSSAGCYNSDGLSSGTLKPPAVSKIRREDRWMLRQPGCFQLRVGQLRPAGPAVHPGDPLPRLFRIPF